MQPFSSFDINFFIARLHCMVSTTKFSCSSQIYRFLPLKAVVSMANLLIFNLACIRAIDNVVNDNFHAVCKLFCSLIDFYKNTMNRVSIQQLYVYVAEQD